MESKTILLEMELPAGRNVVAHFQKVTEIDGSVFRSNPHSYSFSPEDHDFAAIFDGLNANITTRTDEGFPWPPIPPEEWQRAVDVCHTVHTPEVKAAYAAWKAQQSGN